MMVHGSRYCRTAYEYPRFYLVFVKEKQPNTNKLQIVLKGTTDDNNKEIILLI